MENERDNIKLLVHVILWNSCIFCFSKIKQQKNKYEKLSIKNNYKVNGMGTKDNPFEVEV